MLLKKPWLYYSQSVREEGKMVIWGLKYKEKRAIPRNKQRKKTLQTKRKTNKRPHKRNILVHVT